MRVDSWLDRAAALRPGRAALVTERESLTFSELKREATGAAGALRRQGVGSGDHVGLALPAGMEFAVALHACWQLGAVVVPVDLRLAEGERQALEAVCAVVVREPLDRAGEETPAPAHDLDAVAAVIHTSGTSGSPRPVALTYGNWLWSALGSAVALGVDPRERWLCTLPLSHVGGLSILVRSAIYATTAILHERFEAERVSHALHREQVTLVSLVPTTLGRLLETGLRSPPTLRRALLGGGPAATALVARAAAAGVPVSQTYGLTEACSQVATEPANEPSRGDAGPPLFCTRLRIAAHDEIQVAGPTVAPGAAGSDGWLATGDLGELVDGRLRVNGRAADTIITGAENVAPTEVEAVLLEHPAVAEAAVHGRADPEWGEAVVASVVLAASDSVAPEDLRRHCSTRLASFKVPKEIRIVSRLPRTASGKLLRRRLTW
jgi:O-succinylbenzoic acid--CoA ligase